MISLRIGADIGGTFTDLVFLAADGSLATSKALSTPEDFGRAVVEGIVRYLDRDPDNAVAEIRHATTVATNAILEKRGATVGLLTTKGFRDVLEIRRVRLPVLYDITWEKPAPLVRRERRMEVTERMGPDGSVRIPLDRDSAVRALDSLAEKGVDSVAICFLHGYANPAHEQAVADLARRRFRFVSVSSEIVPEVREYERTASTVVDAYVKPIVSTYLGRLSEDLRTKGVQAPLLVMQSNGGIISAEAAASTPVRIIESGPAAGVIAAAAAGRALGRPNLITFDMGGTTAKASIIERGEINLSAEYEVGAAISQTSRLIKGGGHLIRVPSIDVAEVGAGGGSLAWVDAGGVLRVGPESAGAVPGPACYARGGDRPTVTDANLVLGYLNPLHLIGGELALDHERAERAIAIHIGGRLGLGTLDVAAGIQRIANATMQRAIRSVSIERGRDPRDFALIAFGGSGPVHAAGLAEALDIATVIVPPHPGLFSALGLLVADVEQLYTRSVLRDVDRLDCAQINAVLESMTNQASRDLAHEGFAADSILITRYADLRYRKQISELLVPLPERPLADGDRTGLAHAFHGEHRRTYGYAIDDERIEVVALKVRARGLRALDDLQWERIAPGAPVTPTERFTVFNGERVRTAVRGRMDLAAEPHPGPMIIEEYDSTIVVPPGWNVRRGDKNFLFLERAA
jgi:N-methylhydantoinase A